MLEAIDAIAVRRWTNAALAALGRAREEIDALNVYPVPDGDTGTNLYLTVEAAADAVDDVPADADLATTTSAVANGALMGARGNSGIILSQIVRGIATTFAEHTRAAELARAAPSTTAVHPGVRGPALAAALRRSAELAYAAVARPVEGTMLTVARAAAEAAGRAGEDLVSVARAASEGASKALEGTPDQLEALRLAGVVDAGGRGLCVVLDALAAVVAGEAVPEGREPLPGTAAGAAPAGAGAVEACAAAGGLEDGPAFEVMYLLEADDEAIPILRQTLDGLGDSLVVVGGEGLWNVHVHVDDAGAAVEAGIRAGRPYRIAITSFLDDDLRRHGRGGATGSGTRAVVSVVAGEGLAGLFQEAGATVVRGGPGRRASTADLIEGIRSSGAREVVVLPNDADSVAVAEAAARHVRLDGIRVAVVPTRATVQALAAMAVHDAHRRFDDDVVAMTSAAGHTRHGGVTVAAKAAMTTAGACRPGDVLGIVEGDFVLIGSDLAATATAVVDRMLTAGGELVTLVTGADAPAELVDAVVAHLARSRPEVDSVVYDGGQPRYPLLIGVE